LQGGIEDACSVKQLIQQREIHIAIEHAFFTQYNTVLQNIDMQACLINKILQSEMAYIAGAQYEEHYKCIALKHTALDCSLKNVF